MALQSKSSGTKEVSSSTATPVDGSERKLDMDGKTV